MDFLKANRTSASMHDNRRNSVRVRGTLTMNDIKAMQIFEEESEEPQHMETDINTS